MTTTDPRGREELTCADKAAAHAVLARARKLFADLAEALEAEIHRLRAEHQEDDGPIKTVTDLIQRNQKALQTVLDIEAKLLGRAAEAPQLDLEAARAEIARRLARLAV